MIYEPYGVGAGYSWELRTNGNHQMALKIQDICIYIYICIMYVYSERGIGI